MSLPDILVDRQSRELMDTLELSDQATWEAMLIDVGPEFYRRSSALGRERGMQNPADWRLSSIINDQDTREELGGYIRQSGLKMARWSSLPKPGKDHNGDKVEVGKKVIAIADGVTPTDPKQMVGGLPADLVGARKCCEAIHAVAEMFKGTPSSEDFICEMAKWTAKDAKKNMVASTTDDDCPRATFVALWPYQGIMYHGGDLSTQLVKEDGEVFSPKETQPPDIGTYLDRLPRVLRKAGVKEGLVKKYLEATYESKVANPFLLNAPYSLYVYSPDEQKIIDCLGGLPQINIPDKTVFTIIATDGFTLEPPQLPFFAFLPAAVDGPELSIDHPNMSRFNALEYSLSFRFSPDRYFNRRGFGNGSWYPTWAVRKFLNPPDDDATICVVSNPNIHSIEIFEAAMRESFINSQRTVLARLENGASQKGRIETSDDHDTQIIIDTRNKLMETKGLDREQADTIIVLTCIFRATSIINGVDSVLKPKC